MTDTPYDSEVSAAKAAITLALARSRYELEDDAYHQGMGEIVKHHPLAILHVAHYAAIALETAASIQGVWTATELWQKIAPRLDDDEEE